MITIPGRLIVRNLTRTPLARNLSSSVTDASNYADFATISVDRPRPSVFHVQLNRPNKLNAMNPRMWHEIGEVFDALGDDPDCRAIVLSARGRIFSAGLDLVAALGLVGELQQQSDIARRAKILSRAIRDFQSSVTALERCDKPVLAAVHSGCIGVGVDLIAAADIRYCTQDAWFCVKEVDIGIAADVGILQRLPKVIGSQSLARELCLTARDLRSQEAADCGLVSEVFETHEAMVEHAVKVADEIARKSPVAVQATKKSMVYSLDRTVQEGLDHIREMNQLRMQSEDFWNATTAQATKSEAPEFNKL